MLQGGANTGLAELDEVLTKEAISPIRVLSEEEKALEADIQKCRVKPTDNIAEPLTYLGIYNDAGKFIPLFTEGNISVLMGPPKSGKTCLLSIFVAAWLLTKYSKIIGSLPKGKLIIQIYDTEQAKSHVKNNVLRICRMAGIADSVNLEFYSLRGLAPARCAELICYNARKTEGLGVVIIDGIYDISEGGYNDEKESKDIVAKLMALTVDLGIHILSVIHENKGNGHATGWLGRIMTQKAETALAIIKDLKIRGLFHIEPKYCRGLDPDPFSMQLDEFGTPELIEYAQTTKERKSTSTGINDLEKFKQYQILTAAYGSNNGLMYAALQKAIAAIYEGEYGARPGNNNVIKFISRCKELGWIIQAEKFAPYTLGQYDNQQPL